MGIISGGKTDVEDQEVRKAVEILTDEVRRINKPEKRDFGRLTIIVGSIIVAVGTIIGILIAKGII